MVVVELSDEDAELFKKFRQYQEQFKILLSRGVFNEYLGHTEVHKDGRVITRVITVFGYKV